MKRAGRWRGGPISRFVQWALVAAAFGPCAAGAHTRSESHAVWEIKGAEVDLVMTIPALEADRLSNDHSAPSDDRVKAYLADRVYPLSLLELQLPPERLAELLVGFNAGVEAKAQWALPRALVVDVASSFLVALGIFWFVSRSYA